jgi:5-methylcytosine-specific restriction endonuclease McrA
MPTVPSQTTCASLGCKNPRSKLNTFCTEHGGKEYTQARDGDSIYQSTAWRTVRATQLSRQPLCQGCLVRGKVEAAKHVDHVFPWRQIGNHAFMHNIWQSLCPECHSYKTGKEKQGIVLHHTATGTETYQVTDYGAVMHSSMGIR